MNVTGITVEDGAVKLTISPSLEDARESSASYDTIRQIVGRTYEITVRQRQLSNRVSGNEYYAQTRVYASIPNGIDMGMEQPPFNVRGEDPAIDKAWRQFNKLEEAAMRTLVSMALRTVSGLLSGPSDYRVSFSRKAGCSCGCSPGFILKSDTGAFWYSGQPVDIWVSAT